MRRFALAMVALWPWVAAMAGDPAPAAERFVPEIASDAAIEGNEAFVAGDLARARTAYTRVLELVPGNLVGLVNLGVVEFADGNFARAEELLLEAVRTRIETAPAWLTLGIIYMDQGRLNEALAALTQATLYDPGNPRARNYLGVVIGRKGWLDGAQSELRRAVEIDPSYSDAHFNLAYFYLERKPPLVELARRHYLRSLELGAAPDKEIEAEIQRLLEASKPESP